MFIRIKIQAPECPTDYVSQWTGYSLVFFEGNGFGLSQDLGTTGNLSTHDALDLSKSLDKNIKVRLLS